MQNKTQKKKRYYNDVYSDDGIESDDEFSDKDDDISNEEIVEKKKNIQARNGTVAKTTASYTNSYL